MAVRLARRGRKGGIQTAGRWRRVRGRNSEESEWEAAEKGAAWSGEGHEGQDTVNTIYSAVVRRVALFYFYCISMLCLIGIGYVPVI